MKGGDFSNNNHKNSRNRNGNGVHELLSKTSSELLSSYSFSASGSGHAVQSQSCDQQIVSWDECVPFPKLSFQKSAVLVFCLSVLCFVNSLTGNFVFDDNEAILTNNDLLPDTPLGGLFSHDFWGSKLASSTSHKSYRPLTVLTFRLNYYLAGGFHPMGFHLVNILLHGVVSVLFLPVFSVLIGGTCRAPGGAVIFQAPRSSVLCAVLFAVHPIHTESVAGVVGRADLLCALLFVLSFLCYVKACDTGQPGLSLRPPSYSPLWVLSSLILCGLSVLCKEQGITVIGLCSAYDIIHVCRINIFTIFRKPNKDRIHSNLNNNNTTTISNSSKQQVTSDWLRGVIQRHALLFFCGVFLLAVRWKVMGSAPPTFQVMDNPHSFVDGTLLRTLNYNYLYSLNCWLLVNPWWLCFDWSMGCVPVITSFTDPRILAAVAFWVILGLLIMLCWKEEIHHDERLLLLSLSALIVPFLPATNLLFRVGFVVAERVLYLSTTGFCLLFVAGMQRVARRYPRTVPFLKAGVSYVITAMVIRSVQRSADWKSELSLFTAGAEVCPLNAKVHYNIAKVESDRGNTDLAISKYRQAIQLNPDYDQAMNNLGNILKDRGDNQQALDLLSRAVAVRPEFAAAWMNLGIVQAALGKNSEAEQSYFTALKHRRKYPDCLYNLGNLYLEQNRHTEALVAWRNATLQKPSHVNSWSNMMILLTNLNRLEDSETVAKEALRFLPDAANLHYNLANNYGKMQRYADSERHFLRALKLGGPILGIYANLGVLYHRWDRPAEAERAYLKAIELDPQKTGPGTPKDNLELLYRQKGRGPY